MSDPRFPDDPTQQERDALRWAGSTPVSAASLEARRRARAAFLTGSPVVRRPAVWRTLAPLALAASLIGLFWFGTRPTENWTVLEAGEVELVDGPDLNPGASFPHGTAVTTPIGELEAQLGETLHVIVRPGSRVELPPAPGRWLGRARSIRVDEGDLFATTGGRKLDFDLIVETEETRTRILGTTFAVRCNSLGTCVCLFEGTIETRSPDGVTSVRVPTDMRVQFYEAPGIQPTIEPLDDDERAMLEAIHRGGLNAPR